PERVLGALAERRDAADEPVHEVAVRGPQVPVERGRDVVDHETRGELELRVDARRGEPPDRQRVRELKPEISVGTGHDLVGAEAGGDVRTRESLRLPPRQ